MKTERDFPTSAPCVCVYLYRPVDIRSFPSTPQHRRHRQHGEERFDETRVRDEHIDVAGEKHEQGQDILKTKHKPLWVAITTCVRLMLERVVHSPKTLVTESVCTFPRLCTTKTSGSVRIALRRNTSCKR